MAGAGDLLPAIARVFILYEPTPDKPRGDDERFCEFRFVELEPGRRILTARAKGGPARYFADRT